MSYEEELNRFGELKRALVKMTSTEHVRQSMRPVAEAAGNRSLTELRQAAPVGKQEPPYSVPGPDGSQYTINHGRPSIRLFRASLIDGWGAPEIEPVEGGASFTILSNAPHMDWLLRGVPAHPIPKRPMRPLSFYSFSLKMPVIFDFWNSYTIEHPGFKQSNFVQDTLDQGLGQEIAALQQRGTRNVRMPLTQFFR